MVNVSSRSRLPLPERTRQQRKRLTSFIAHAEEPPMRDFRDAKAMAQTLREALKTKSISLTHSESLELVAKMLGFHDWNELTAKIQSESEGAVANPATLIPASAAPPVARADLPVVPMRDIVLLPHMIVPLFVGRDATKLALERAMAEDRRILVVTQRREADDHPTPSALYSVGVTASVIDLVKLDDGTLKVLAKCLKRAAIMQWAEGPFLAAAVSPIEETRGNDEEALALSRAVREKLKAHRKTDILSSAHDHLSDIEEPGLLADAVASHIIGKIEQKQEILEAADVITRLQKVLALMQTDQQAA
jgi:ATP-dependent Lon protease